MIDAGAARIGTSSGAAIAAGQTQVSFRNPIHEAMPILYKTDGTVLTTLRISKRRKKDLVRQLLCIRFR